MQTIDYQRVNGGGVNYQTSFGKNFILQTSLLKYNAESVSKKLTINSGILPMYHLRLTATVLTDFLVMKVA